MADRKDPCSTPWGFWVAGAFAGGIVVLGGLGLLWWRVLAAESANPSLVVATFVITAVLMLMVGFAIFSGTFQRLKLAAPGEALGLPKGTVRALLAFVLLVMFGMLAVFFFQQLQPTGRLEGVTPTMYEKLDPESIVSSTLNNSGNYTVVLRSDASTSQADLAKQVTTALVTLVTALSAFYFGAQAGTPKNGKPEATSPSGTAPGDSTGPTPDKPAAPAGQSTDATPEVPPAATPSTA